MLKSLQYNIGRDWQLFYDNRFVITRNVSKPTEAQQHFFFFYTSCTQEAGVFASCFKQKLQIKLPNATELFRNLITRILSLNLFKQHWSFFEPDHVVLTGDTDGKVQLQMPTGPLCLLLDSRCQTEKEAEVLLDRTQYVMSWDENRSNNHP